MSKTIILLSQHSPLPCSESFYGIFKTHIKVLKLLKVRHVLRRLLDHAPVSSNEITVPWDLAKNWTRIKLR